MKISNGSKTHTPKERIKNVINNIKMNFVQCTCSFVSDAACILHNGFLKEVLSDATCILHNGFLKEVSAEEGL